MLCVLCVWTAFGSMWLCVLFVNYCVVSCGLLFVRVCVRLCVMGVFVCVVAYVVYYVFVCAVCD